MMNVEFIFKTYDTETNHKYYQNSTMIYEFFVFKFIIICFDHVREICCLLYLYFIYRSVFLWILAWKTNIPWIMSVSTTKKAFHLNIPKTRYKSIWSFFYHSLQLWIVLSKYNFYNFSIYFFLFMNTRFPTNFIVDPPKKNWWDSSVREKTKTAINRLFQP